MQVRSPLDSLKSGSLKSCDCSDCDLLQGKLPKVANPRETNTKIRLLVLGLMLTGGFSGVEWVAGWWSNSLTLVTDAGHMASDCLALGLSLAATGLAQLAVYQQARLGLQRAELLAALANGIGLLVLAFWVAWEAINRFQSSHPAVVSEVMLITAIIGLGMNTLAVSIFHSHSHHDLNLRGAFLHILADTVSSAGVILAAVLIWAFHWNWADEVISLVIAGVMVVGAVPLIWESLSVLRQGAIAQR
ncbi:MAG: cation diffusion facilitator family transporter [Tildeniella torsiva UHER 1998/13D]|nr:cation diffusion facilitator family transporter [Tildeniella torsiva UHER 1998/13D]